MSAYLNGRGSQVLPFSPPSVQGVSESLEQHVPSLPQIVTELENFFIIARKIEAVLAQERSQSRKYRDELREVQVKYAHYSAEAESKLKECSGREEKLKAQLTAQLNAQQQIEKNLHDQLNEVCSQFDALRDQKKKLEVELEIVKSNLEHSKRNEATLKSTLKSFQMGEKSRTEHSEQIAKEMGVIRQELSRYQAAWGQISAIDRKAKGTLQRSVEIEQKLEEYRELEARSKRYRDDLEELLKKERREKQAALTCLHTAEAKLSQASRELDEHRKQKARHFEPNMLELKF